MVEVLCTMLSGTFPFDLEKETGYKPRHSAPQRGDPVV